MSKYDALWVWIKEKGTDGFKLTFAKIQQIAGLPIDHSFLKYKKELRQTMKKNKAYGEHWRKPDSAMRVP